MRTKKMAVYSAKRRDIKRTKNPLRRYIEKQCNGETDMEHELFRMLILWTNLFSQFPVKFPAKECAVHEPQSGVGIFEEALGWSAESFVLFRMKDIFPRMEISFSFRLMAFCSSAFLAIMSSMSLYMEWDQFVSISAKSLIRGFCIHALRLADISMNSRR